MSNLFPNKISNEDLNQLPLDAFPGKIVCIDTIEKADRIARFLAKQHVLGFDTETKPAFKRGQRNGIALLQLSTLDEAFIFRINKIGLPKSVADILANENIIKAGAAVKDDIVGLQRLQKFKAGGFIELQKLSEKYGIDDNALKKMAGIVMGFRISKSEQLSNWEQDRLTQRQLKYAATDAWVGLLIYRGLVYGERYPIIRN